MRESGDVIRFDRATYPQGGPPGAPCGSCKRPIEDQYWKFQTSAVCGPCRDAIAARLSSATAAASFGKASLRGAGVALACGTAYAVFVAVSRLQLALVTIGVAFVIARVVRNASGGVGGRRFQVLAVALTYLASTMGYVPPLLRGIFEHSADSAHHAEAATDTKSDGAPAEPAAPESPKHSTAVAVVMFVGVVLGFALIAPFLELKEAPLGLLIVAFGLWEAWKRTRAIPIVLEGPFRLVPATESLPPS